jgi:hypothetical protein
MTPDIAALKEKAEKATPLNLDTAEQHLSGSHTCPFCDGDGDVSGETYVNFDGAATGVQFFGIGPEFGALEEFVRAANPQAVLALIAALEAAEALAREQDKALGILIGQQRDRAEKAERERDEALKLLQRIDYQVDNQDVGHKDFRVWTGIAIRAVTP